jgi:exodeoxyribonuclease V beta subunit
MKKAVPKIKSKGTIGFDAVTVPLEKSNLIEASAGTGKTYSVAILVLRLILEKGLAVKEILMVTFTKAATAELEERVRLFIRLAQRSSAGLPGDTTIEGLVKQAVKKHSAQIIAERMSRALADLDETAVMTIHGFCQTVLKEFAFETKQLYGAETLENISGLITDAVNEFWRKRISILDIELLKILGLDKAQMTSTCLSAMDGKKFLAAIDPKIDVLNNPTVKKSIIKKLTGLNDKERLDLLKQIKLNIYAQAIEEIQAEVLKVKSRENLLSFDDMILNLHKAVTDKTNTELLNSLREKYKAVFIDEFQDTDKLQYEIFSTAFGDSSILFYIGDPKQSIYGWRKADIFTYFKAANEVENQYTMNINFRSSERYIEAMNQFFLPEKSFDTFYYADQTEKIEYVPVKASSKITGELYIGKDPDIPISIFEAQNNPSILPLLITQVVDLLSNKKYQIKDGNASRGILPADIGILISKNNQAQPIKSALAAYGIKAIAVDESRILKSAEAVETLHFLQALAGISRSSIYKALLSRFTGYTSNEIVNLDDEEEMKRFEEYRTLCEKDGIYAVMLKFISDFGVRSRLMNLEGGDRSLSNLIQLVDLLSKVQTEKQFSVTELANWLAKEIESDSGDGDEFVQRMESDEEAVKIVTVHKSKGLEYNIVLSPYLDLYTFLYNDEVKFRDSVSEDYYFGDKTQLTNDQKQILYCQLEQENRRKIYVAITRAVYKCYIYKSTFYTSLTLGDKKCSALVPFMNSFRKTNPSLIRFDDAPVIASGTRIGKAGAWTPALPKTIAAFKLNGINWRKMSYSFITASHEATLKNNTLAISEGYGKFIFKDLPKGALTGNMLHYIFEHADFTDAKSKVEVIQNALLRFMPQRANEYKNLLLQMVEHVLQAKIAIGGEAFSLGTLPKSKRLNELEFDFKVPPFKVSEIEKMSTSTVQILTKSYEELEGILNGKMDLFFEMNGKYYILDWKSNFLGDSLADYEFPNLNDAMNENNYHLQYLIYTLAAKKYLESRIAKFDYETQFGGVIYLFLRGVRENSAKGVFTARPSLSEIKKLEAIFSAMAEASS